MTEEEYAELLEALKYWEARVFDTYEEHSEAVLKVNSLKSQLDQWHGRFSKRTWPD